jgi:hypothetical protein
VVHRRSGFLVLVLVVVVLVVVVVVVVVLLVRHGSIANAPRNQL